MFSERGFIRPDIEMLDSLIKEKDSIVVVKRGQCSVLNRSYKRGFTVMFSMFTNTDFNKYCLLSFV